MSDINYYIHVTFRHSIKQPNRLIEAAQEHKEIYEAIVKKDKALAKANVEKHIRDVYKRQNHDCDGTFM